MKSQKGTSNNISFGEKSYEYFLGYLYSDDVKLLNIMLPKTSAYIKSYDGQTRWIYFLNEDDDLLEKYNTIQHKVSVIKVNSEAIYNKKNFESPKTLSW